MVEFALKFSLLVAFLAWLAWALTLLAMMALVKPNAPCHTGFRIVMPLSFIEQLSSEEQVAVYMHEQGHQHYKHVWKNYFRVVVFKRFSEDRRRAQEFEADDFVIELGYGKHLANALFKTCTHEFDVYRANRILRIVAFKMSDDLIFKLCKA
jgi:Zn-dependent protease with chaperone function